jgi:hypothetical protein
MLSVANKLFMLSAIMLSVIVLSVVIMSVVVPLPNVKLTKDKHSCLFATQ